MIADFITIINQDDSGHNCKLTMEHKAVEVSSWWRKLFLGEKPIIRVIVNVWYGYEYNWITDISDVGPSVVQSKYFYGIWKYHMKEKKRLGITGPYKSIINMRTGDIEGIEPNKTNNIIQFNRDNI